MFQALFFLLVFLLPNVAHAQCSSVREHDDLAACRAYDSDSSSYCSQIRDHDKRAYCLGVVRGNTSYCSQIRSSEYRQACTGGVQFKKAMMAMDEEERRNLNGPVHSAGLNYCGRIYSSNYRNMCRAIRSKNSSYCGMISGDTNLRNYCHAWTNLNMSYCSSIRDLGMRARCKRSINSKLRNRRYNSSGGEGDVLSEDKPTSTSAAPSSAPSGHSWAAIHGAGAR